VGNGQDGGVMKKISEATGRAAIMKELWLRKML